MLDAAQRTSAKKERASGGHRELVAILFETGRFWSRAMKIFAFKELTYAGLPLNLGPEVRLDQQILLAAAGQAPQRAPRGGPINAI
jgi:hypothetical protein